MSYLNKVARAIRGLQRAADIVGISGDNVAAKDFISDAKTTLEGIQYEMNTLYGKRTIAEGGRDSLLLAIAGTCEGRCLDVTKPNEAIPQAITIIRSMDADIRTSREADEIPFGAVEQDSDKMQLEQRIAELELQFELKVDECTATENHLREFKAQWLSLINYINNISPDLLKGVEVCNCENSIGGGSIKASETSSHELKIKPEFFEPVLSGHKTAEIRCADRPLPFCAGDELWLREFTTEEGYTGRDVYRVITHVTDLKGYMPGYVMLSMTSK